MAGYVERGAARYTGGFWVGKFMKTVACQGVGQEAGAFVGEYCSGPCETESFRGHKRRADLGAGRRPGVSAR